MKTAEDIVWIKDQIIKNGGITININMQQPTTGKVVSIKGHEERIPVEKFTSLKLFRYIDKQRHILGSDHYYIGAWIEDDHVFLDISTVYHSKDIKLLCELHEQKAYYDLDKKETVYV